MQGLLKLLEQNGAIHVFSFYRQYPAVHIGEADCQDDQWWQRKCKIGRHLFDHKVMGLRFLARNYRRIRCGRGISGDNQRYMGAGSLLWTGGSEFQHA